jgi:uncharacterized phage protein (TIGR02218 family)
MKAASSALIDYLNSVRASPDAQLLMADAYIFTLRSGSTLCYTDIDVTFTYNGNTFLANAVRISGLKYKAAIGLEVDSQQITAAALSTDLVGGGPSFLQALREGVFDGALVERDRVFFSDQLGGTVIGSVILFQGRLGSIDQIGRTTAKLTVNSDLCLLDNDMPRNIFQPTCLHTLYDSGCGLVKADFGTNGTAGAGATDSVIPWSGASTNFVQGSITFTSGVNNGVTATVASVAAGTSLTLAYPLEEAPSEGDAFTVYFGCDHTPVTCRVKFNDFVNFRGFPYVPPPQMAV